MKSIVVFYNENSVYSKEKVFDGKSAQDLSKIWAESVNPNAVVTVSNKECVLSLMEEMVSKAEENDCDTVILGFSSVPFYNKNLTLKLLENHQKYYSEYTFAEGYSFGFAPEIIDCGILKILIQLCKTDFAEEGRKKITKDFFFNLLKQDINSFEIETLLAKTDWKLLRLDFACNNKADFLACKALYESCKAKGVDVLEGDVEEINQLASVNPSILKTLPGFYNIQITDRFVKKCTYCPYADEYEKKNGKSCIQAKNFMKKEDFTSLVNKIAAFSEEGVIGLSLWGEPAYHPELLDFIKIVLSKPGLSAFLETTLPQISQDFANELKNIVESADSGKRKWPSVMFAVAVDSFTEETYKKIHGDEGSLGQALDAVKILARAIPHSVYPQFVRMNDNEEELESFYRFWNEKTSPSNGEFIIQKYDDFCGLLSGEKTADLSPIERNVCWHLRRDLNILTNGDVILCKEYVLDNVIGNVFCEPLEEIWKKMDVILMDHMNKKYENKCGACDEFYTYNF